MPEILDHIPYIQEKCLEHFGSIPAKIERFTTGLCHYVYSIEYPEEKYVIRVSTDEQRTTLKSGIYWIEKLKDLNLPIPQIIIDGTDEKIPYTILTYLPGDDLGNVYHTLDESQKKSIAQEMAQIQTKVRNMPEHHGYGNMSSYDDANYCNTWKDFILKHISGTRKRMEQNRIFETNYVDMVIEKLNKYENYFLTIKPTPFLEDTTTKNVLIKDGKITGIVDIDWMGFGDYLYVIGMTNMALLVMEKDTDYVNYWIEEGCFNEQQKAIVPLYTLIYCIDFMSEIGMKFNGTQPLQPSPEKIKKLKEIYSILIEKI